MKSDQDRHAGFMRTAFEVICSEDMGDNKLLSAERAAKISAEWADLMLAEHRKRFLPGDHYIPDRGLAVPESAVLYADLRNALSCLARVHTRDDKRSGYTVVPGMHPDPRTGGVPEGYVEAWATVRRYLGLPVEPEEKK